MKKLLCFLFVIGFVFSNVAPVEALDFECPTPKSIMLHSWYGEEQTEVLARYIIDNGYNTITYVDLYGLWDQGMCPAQNDVLVSLDDFYTVYPNQKLGNMIDIFLEYGLVMTVGVITRSEPYSQNPKIWDYLKGLDEAGFEIASHSVNHLNPYEISHAEIEEELSLSRTMICENLGKCPKTYILPYGAGYNYSPLTNASERIGYRGLVSIAGPTIYDGDLFILKRASPIMGDVVGTFDILDIVFPWFETTTENFGKKYLSLETEPKTSFFKKERRYDELLFR